MIDYQLIASKFIPRGRNLRITGSRLLNLCIICTVFDSSIASDCFTLRAFPMKNQDSQ